MIEVKGYLCFAHKRIPLSVSHRFSLLCAVKSWFCSWNRCFWGEVHEKYKIQPNIKNIIRNCLKCFFKVLRGHINPQGWPLGPFPDFIFSVKFWWFYVKNGFFCWFWILPHSFFMYLTPKTAISAKKSTFYSIK